MKIKTFKSSLIIKIISYIALFMLVFYIVFGYFIIQPDINLIEKQRNYYLVTNINALEDRKKSHLEFHTKEVNNRAEILAKNISIFLLNLDQNSLKDSILFNIKDKPVKGIKVFNHMDEELFFSLYIEGDKNFINKAFPSYFKKYEKISKPVIFKNRIGTLVLYCDKSIVLKELRDYEKKTYEKIEDFDNYIEELFFHSIINKLVLTIVFLVIFLIIISYLLINMVSKPLNELKLGLSSFFLFLQNKTSSTSDIIIDSNDEFGQMAKSINKNIKISQKLHNEIKELNQNLEHKIKERTIELEILNKHLSDSIKVASTIQNSILPDDSKFKNIFKDNFIYWKPKDTVSGDLYLAIKLSDTECFIVVVDCTGHGVSGAFISMLVKAIEKDFNILKEKGELDINNSYDIASPAKVLKIFNQKLKDILKQNDSENIDKLDFGFDGGVLYINYDKQLGIYSGARMPLYIIENREFKTLKPDRVSIGYSKTNINFEFKEYLIDLSNPQILYITSDGYLDQLGGEKGFPFGKKRFISILEANQDKPLEEQKNILIDEITKYQGNYEQTDDRTIIGIKF
jgi:serine phosphatase RsbU (regulator of sigma subunit)